MTGTKSAVSCAGIVLFACLAALLAPVSHVHATDLSLNPSLDASGRGLTVRALGAGLAESGGAYQDMAFGSFNGPIRQAYLFWGGFHQPGGAPQASLDVRNAAGQTVTMMGTLIGTDQGDGRTWFAYRANITAIVSALAAQGAVTLEVKVPASLPTGTTVNGASALVAHTDPLNPSFYRARIAEGSQFVFGGENGSNGQTTPVTYLFDPAVTTRPAQLSLVVGNASPMLRDVVVIADNKPRIDELSALEGPAWDSPTFSVFVPAASSQTSVTVISPPVFGDDADRLHVVAMSYRLICGGQIGDFVWLDQNGNGIQDPGEPGVPGVHLILEILDDESGNFLEIAVTESDAAGGYLFEGICAGLYRIKADPMSFEKGAVPVAAFQGGDPTLDSNFVFKDGFYVAFVQLDDDGDSNIDVDLGLAPGITIFTGACCLPDGTCTETFAATCVQSGGTFFGIGIPCSSVEPCPQPALACCLSDGSCVTLSAAACLVQGGTAQPFGVLCADANCAQPALACCLPDGSCITVLADACTAQGGTPQAFGVACADANCPQPALACCLPDGSCITVLADACTAQGGAPQAFSVACADADCPQPLLACCLPDGSCITVLADACTAQGGTPQAFGVACADVSCPQPELACCLPDGSCITVLADACTAQGGTPQPFAVACMDIDCTQPSLACCLPDGTCITVLAGACVAQGGTPQVFGMACADANCAQPELACCLPDGSCITVLAASCTAQGGTPQAFGVSCAAANCPQPELACCLPDGSCITVLADACTAQGGTPQTLGVSCAAANCPQPVAACCLPSGACIEVTQAQCALQGGTWQGFQVLCADVMCPMPKQPMLRVRAAEKGSLLYFSKVDVRWDENGHLVRDTFISLTNDHPDNVRVLMYFINGDEPLEAMGVEPAHPGWNFVDNAITLTGQQPIYWSAATGAGTVGGLSPFLVLDPGMPPGRPVGDGSGHRMIRGFIVGWATTAEGDPIRFNHLAGAGTIVDYLETSAWEYPAFAFRAIAGTHGSTIGMAGSLNLDGMQYASGYEQLLANFSAVGSASMSTQNQLVEAFGQTTIHPVDLDVRLNAADAGPVTTRIMVDVWNENEVKFSGTSICVTCWNSTLLQDYATPNQFRLDHLQTERGKARFRSTTGPACDESAPHELVSLLGLIEHALRFEGGVMAGLKNIDRAGGPMFGMGLRSATIRHDVESLPPEAPALQRVPTAAFEDVDQWLQSVRPEGWESRGHQVTGDVRSGRR